jgi:hypothetical protein
LKALATHCPTTNMRLEGLLAQTKASCSQRGKPYVENLGYCAVLSSLLRQHLDDGNGNPFRELREDMLADGVPLNRTRGESQQQSRIGQRPDVTWRNVQLNLWTVANPQVSMRQHTPIPTHGHVQGTHPGPNFASQGAGIGVCYFYHFSSNDGKNIPLP